MMKSEMKLTYLITHKITVHSIKMGQKTETARLMKTGSRSAIDGDLKSHPVIWDPILKLYTNYLVIVIYNC